jgi:hypothetical protein
VQAMWGGRGGKPHRRGAKSEERNCTESGKYRHCSELSSAVSSRSCKRNGIFDRTCILLETALLVIE